MKMSYKDHLPDNIKKARENYKDGKMTQPQLAELIGVEPQMISYYENDKKEMRASGLAEMARVLQTTPNYLLGYTYSDDDFLSEALSLLEGIKDETIKKVLLAQIKAASAL